jgi:VWFA-related protein
MRASLLVATGMALAAFQQPQQPPVFRGGAHYVRVDAYPTRDGKIIDGLTSDDFEILEDGKLQQVADVELVPYDAPPDDDRGSIMSARQGLELAADPHYRVFVFVIDRASFDDARWREMRASLQQFFQTEIGPRDLLGLITTDRPWTDLVVGRRLSSIEEEIDAPEWLHAGPQEETAALADCGVEEMGGRVHADETYSLLEGIIGLLGQVREDRTSVVFVSNGLTRQGPDDRLARQHTLHMPTKIGLVNGRIQRIPGETAMHQRYCTHERSRLAEMDFSRRFDEMVKSARGSNVAFYPVAVPLVLSIVPGVAGMQAGRGGFGVRPVLRPGLLPDSLAGLAGATDGFAVTGDKDVRGSLARIVNDVPPHYLLGYYTTNSKWDGRVRSISVTLKKTGAPIRARRFYRAPTRKEIEALSAPRVAGPAGPPPAVAAAIGALSRIRTSTQFFTYGAVADRTLTVVVEVPAAAVQAGRWKDGAALDVMAETADGKSIGMSRGRLTPNGRALMKIPIDGTEPASTVFVRLRSEGESLVQRTDVEPIRSTLVGDPLAYRSGPRGLAVPVAFFELARDERLKLDWPVLAKLDRFEARMLDRNGQPFRHRVSVEQQDASDGRHLVTNLSLTSLGRGDYVVELEVAAGVKIERKLLAFRVK